MSEDHGVFAPPLPPEASRPKSDHGQLFSALLIALGFLCLIIIGQFYALLQSPSVTAESRWFFYYIICMQAVFLLAIVLALVVRAFFPSMRRVMTIAVSIFLLLHFPFGTVIGIYGLTKVQRPLLADAQ